MLAKLGCNNKETILLGDSNVIYIKNKDHQEEKDIIASHGFKKFTNSPTRVAVDSISLIDILLSKAFRYLEKNGNTLKH